MCVVVVSSCVEKLAAVIDYASCFSRKFILAFNQYFLNNIRETMLAIAPMPVDGVNEKYAEHKAAPLILLPALPAASDHYDVMTIDQAPPHENGPTSLPETDFDEEQAFFIDSSSQSVVLPPRRQQIRQVRPAVQRKNTRPKLSDPKAFRAAEQVSDSPDELVTESTIATSRLEQLINSKYTVLTLFALVVVVFLFLVVYCVKQFACPPDSTASSGESALQYVRVRNDDYNHLKERYGEKAKAAALREKQEAYLQKTKIIQDDPSAASNNTP
jgi:hypothetical protein